MSKTARQMALTKELVARTHREIADPGPFANLIYHSEEDYDALGRSLLASHP